MALTNVAIISAKPGAKPFKVADADGLHLLVQPNSARNWRMNYRYLGKHKALAFGVWPDISLADARAKWDAARRLIANGIDPDEKAKQDKIAANVGAANTFEAVANERLAKSEREALSVVTPKKNRWLLGLVTPALGRRPKAPPPCLCPSRRTASCRMG